MSQFVYIHTCAVSKSMTGENVTGREESNQPLGKIIDPFQKSRKKMFRQKKLEKCTSRTHSLPLTTGRRGRC